MAHCEEPMDPSAIDALIHRVSSVSDRDARVRLLAEQRECFTEEEWAEFERALMVRAGLRDENAQRVLLALTEASAEKATPRKDMRPSPEADWGTGRPLTLGERKALARNADRRLLEKALRDAHPAVIAEVLRNPRVTEADVARLCASPKTRADVLALVLASPRWAARVHVRRAIAMNPATPAPLARSLVPLLERSDLREIAFNEKLAPSVRAQALAILRRLPPTPKPEPTRH